MCDWDWWWKMWKEWWKEWWEERQKSPVWNYIDPYPDGGCPYVFVHNGIKYIEDNNILQWSENKDGTSRDVTDFYRLEKSLVPSKGKYHLLIREFENEHSYIDQVQLIAVDYPDNVDIVPTREGKILTYSNPLKPQSCIDQNKDDQLMKIKGKVDGYFKGHAGCYLILDWGKLRKAKRAKLVLYSDGPLTGYLQPAIVDLTTKTLSIHIQIQNKSGGWHDIATLRPRENWGMDIIDISEFLPILKKYSRIKLLWTASHKLDYIGLDISENQTVKSYTLIPLTAIHSHKGSVIEEVMKLDSNYTEIVPGEEIRFSFKSLSPPSDDYNRDFILKIRGRYIHIQK